MQGPIPLHVPALSRLDGTPLRGVSNVCSFTPTSPCSKICILQVHMNLYIKIIATVISNLYPNIATTITIF